MAYFYPFGSSTSALNSLFAQTSVTASFSASVNTRVVTASYVDVAIYPGPQGPPGNSVAPGPCPSGYIECPGLLAQVSPEYTMVCLQTGSGCLPGEFPDCPAVIPGPTTTTTSTTTTSTTTTTTEPPTTTTTTSTTTTTTESPTTTTTTSTTTTTTEPPTTTTTTSTTTIAPGEFISVAEGTYTYTDTECLGNPYMGGDVSAPLQATLVNSVGTPVTNTSGSPIGVTILYSTYYNNGCGSPGTTTYTRTIVNGTSSDSEVVTIEVVAECGSGCNTEGINNPCIQSITSGSGTGPYNIYAGSSITACP